MGLVRLGETQEFGWTLLELLGLSGWEIAVTTPFAGAHVDERGTQVDSEHAGVLISATKDGHDVRMTGETVASAACEVFEECARRQRLHIEQPVQLRVA